VTPRCIPNIRLDHDIPTPSLLRRPLKEKEHTAGDEILNVIFLSPRIYPRSRGVPAFLQHVEGGRAGRSACCRCWRGASLSRSSPPPERRVDRYLDARASSQGRQGVDTPPLPSPAWAEWARSTTSAPREVWGSSATSTLHHRLNETPRVATHLR
jgi:hypothetical protein